MYALQGGRIPDAVLIDNKALLTDQDRKYVYVVDKDGKAQRRDVIPGRKPRASHHRERIGGWRSRDHRRLSESVHAGHAGERQRGADAGRCSIDGCDEMTVP